MNQKQDASASDVIIEFSISRGYLGSLFPLRGRIKILMTPRIGNRLRKQRPPRHGVHKSPPEARSPSSFRFLIAREKGPLDVSYQIILIPERSFISRRSFSISIGGGLSLPSVIRARPWFCPWARAACKGLCSWRRPMTAPIGSSQDRARVEKER